MTPTNPPYRLVQVGFPPKPGTSRHAALIKAHSKDGSSNAGEHQTKKFYAGKAGGAAPYTYPIDTMKDAEDALRLRGKAPNPDGIMRAVFERWPQLKSARTDKGLSTGHKRSTTMIKKK